MANDPLDNHLRAISWRRKLSAAEAEQMRQWLEGHPEAQADWEAELALGEAFDGLPNVLVPSNFTSRVLQAVEREEAADVRGSRPRWRVWRPMVWLRRAAVAGVVVTASLLSFHQIHVIRARELVQPLEVVSDVASLPKPNILEDFDTIRALNSAPPADEQLLALMQ